MPNKWEDIYFLCFWIGRFRLSGWQYSPNFDYQNPVFPFIKRNWQADPKSKTKCKASKIAEVILENKNKAEGLTLLNTIIHYKTIVVKAVCYWYKNRHVTKWNRIENSEVNPHIPDSHCCMAETKTKLQNFKKQKFFKNERKKHQEELSEKCEPQIIMEIRVSKHFI